MDSQRIDPAGERTPEQIEREMAHTRESISEKVAALENQVLGTVQTAADTISGTVEAVKSIVTTGPEAVSDTVKQSVAAMTDAVKETLDVRKQVRENPWTALGIAATAGLVTGLLVFRRDSRSPLGAMFGCTTPEARRMAEATPQAVASPSYTPPPSAPREPGLFDELWGRVRAEVGQLAETAFKTASASLRENLETQVPKLVEEVVHSGTETLQNRLHSGNGAPVSRPTSF